MQTGFRVRFHIVMARFYIQKSNGEKEYFQDKKLLGSFIKASLDKAEATSLVKEIKKEVTSGVTSDDIHSIAYKKLCKTHLPQAQLYNLRKALAEIPPKQFEQYVQRILETDGYACEWEKIVKGAGTSHEVDVVAKKGDNCFMIECKRRGNWHKPSGLGKVLIVRARHEDILDGNKKGNNKYGFTRAWLINNAKFSAHAREYAAYKGIWLTGWGYPAKMGINEWIQHLQVYPVTMLRLSKKEIQSLLQVGILTFSEFEKNKAETAKRVLSKNAYENALSQIRSIRQCTL